jgi:hypothetical protein
VLPIVERAELADAGHYDGVPDATVAMATDERIHARVLAGLTPSTVRAADHARRAWHRGDASGSLRAAIFGVNDGLVSNLALVMGVAGGTATAADPASPGWPGFWRARSRWARASTSR